MANYEKCKETAENKAKEFDLLLGKAYALGNAFVFDTQEEYMGAFPVVVDDRGECQQLWAYLNEHDLTMDDMNEVDL